ncbi:MAG: tetratricopeptide repeat protein [Pyrinomonadaceae bacterium]
MKQLKLVILLSALALLPLTVAAQRTTAAESLERAVSLIREQRTPEAEQELNKILRKTPNEPIALNLLGTIRAQQGRLDEAEKLFSRAVALDSHFVGAHMNLARLYLLKGAPEKTGAELKEVLRLEPNNKEASYELARLLMSQGQIAACVSFIERLQTGQTLSPKLLTVLGEAYLALGDADKSEESFLLALNEDRNNAEAILGLARVSVSRGNTKVTAAYLTRVQELVPNSPELLYGVGLTALRAGFFDEAKSVFEKAGKLRPREPAYLIALGAVWLKKPDLFEAEKAFRRAIELQPNSAQGQMYLGYTLLKQKKYLEAQTLLEKSVKSGLDIPEPFYYLGLIAQEQNEDERAVEILENLIQRFPEFANAHVALGTSYLKLKNYPRAQQELELAAKLKPDESKAHYQLAILYARLKDQTRAQEELRIVEKLKDANKTQDKGSDTPAVPNPR